MPLPTHPPTSIRRSHVFFFLSSTLNLCLLICLTPHLFYLVSFFSLSRAPPPASVCIHPQMTKCVLSRSRFPGTQSYPLFFFRSFSIILFLFSFYLYFFFPFSSRVCYLGSPLSSVMKLNERLILSLLIHYLLVWRWGGSSCLGWGIHIVHVSLYIFFVDSL